MVTIWPRQSTTARSVRVNAADAVGSGRPASTRSTSGRSCPMPVDPSTSPTTRPATCRAGSTKGSRSSASASLPIGSEASRSAMLTSLVTPPAPTRISRSTNCGNW